MYFYLDYYYYYYCREKFRANWQKNIVKYYNDNNKNKLKKEHTFSLLLLIEAVLSKINLLIIKEIDITRGKEKYY